MVYYVRYDSPVGALLLTSDGQALTGLWMEKKPPQGGQENALCPVLQQAVRWLDAYFQGQEPVVELPMKPEGTPFQKQVWDLLRNIPYGKVRSYGSLAKEVAELLGKKTMSAQAVGQAVGKNPISILIPCHRIIGTGGKLTGYAGGLERKRWLLTHEGWTIEDTIVIEAED